MESHTIEAALRRGELSEEEAYFVLRFAGHLGYDRAIKRLSDPLKVARQWLVWVGGWEPATLRQWDEGLPAWRPFYRGKLQSPTPVSAFGHRITVNQCGASRWVNVRMFGGYLHVSLDKSCVYWSPNATPSHPDAVYFVGRRPAN